MHDAPIQPADGVCRTCKTSGAPKKCSKCKLVFYCSKEYQINDWDQHKRFCKKTSKTVKEERRPGHEDAIFSTKEETRVIENRQRREQGKEDHMSLRKGWYEQGNEAKFLKMLTPEQMTVIKRAPRGSLELAIRYAKQRLPTFTVIEKFADIPSEYNPCVAYFRPFVTEVLVAFIFMYHEHVMRHSVYLKDVQDKITHVEFYFDHLEDDPTPHFTYDQVKPDNYILIKNPVMHIFKDGEIGLRINHPFEVMFFEPAHFD